jgi:hypothetical protein
METTSTAITSYHIRYAAELLGNIIAEYPTQCLIESCEASLKYIERHANNRHVSMEWVESLKKVMLEMIHFQEIILIDVAITTGSIEVAIHDPDTSQEQGGFKAYILDGQHRVEALKQIMREHPDIKFAITYKVVMVNSDSEISDRIAKLNQRRNFDQSDIDKTAVCKNFLMAIEKIIGKQNMNRQYIMKLKKSNILNNTVFIDKHKNKTIDQFCTAINTLANSYKSAWVTRSTDDTKFDKSVVGQLIRNSKMYQFIHDPNDWINLIN